MSIFVPVFRRGTIALAVVSLSMCVGACSDADSTSVPVEDSSAVDADTQQADTGSDTGSVDTTSEDTTPVCAENASCDDGDPCTDDDRCDAAGACAGQPNTCDDGLTCTQDQCTDGVCSSVRVAGFCLTEGDSPACVADTLPSPANGCEICDANTEPPSFTVLVDGSQCNDDDACTRPGTCAAGSCIVGDGVICLTDNPCLDASCDSALGCVYTPHDEACTDNNPCTVGDVCNEGECVSGDAPLDCDDEDACTIDSCEPTLGCVNDAASLCSDDDPCTVDACDDGVCSHPAAVEGSSCQDGNACTQGETCDAGGLCVGGSTITCDDFSECTLDSCHPTLGCLHLFAEGSCDDGADCTVNDKCVAGECFGAKTNQCDFCSLEGTDHATKLVTLELVGNGMAGSGIDVDKDPTSCAPVNACSGGVDNAMAAAAYLVNDGIEQSIDNGSVMWVVDFRDARHDGTEFPLAIYDTSLTDADELAGCNFQIQSCEYDVHQLSFDEYCQPYFGFSNAKIVDGVLTAGGDDALISLVLPLTNGSLLGMTVAWARVEGVVETNSDGEIIGLTGIIGGAVPKAQLIEAILGLDASDLPIDKDVAVSLLNTFVLNDIDLDGDGLDESVSLGIRINGISAAIDNEGTLLP